MICSCLLYTTPCINGKCFLGVLQSKAKTKLSMVDGCSLKLYEKHQKYSSILNPESRPQVGRKQAEDRNFLMLKDLFENQLSFLFQLLEASWIPWLMDPPSICKASRAAFSNISFWPTSHLLLWLNLLPPSFPCKDPCDNVGATWLIQGNASPQDPELNHIFKSPLACKVM